MKGNTTPEESLGLEGALCSDIHILLWGFTYQVLGSLTKSALQARIAILAASNCMLPHDQA